MPQFLNLEKQSQYCPPPVGFYTQGFGYSMNATVPSPPFPGSPKTVHQSSSPAPMLCRLLHEHCSVPGARGCPYCFGNPKGKCRGPAISNLHPVHQNTLNPLLGQEGGGMNHFCVNRRYGEEDRKPASLRAREEQLAGRGPGACTPPPSQQQLRQNSSTIGHTH